MDKVLLQRCSEEKFNNNSREKLSKLRKTVEKKKKKKLLTLLQFATDQSKVQGDLLANFFISIVIFDPNYSI